MDYKIRTKVKRIVVDEEVPLGAEITILGMVRTIRSGKDVAFIEINDGSTIKNIQAVISQPDKFPILEEILTGASVRVKGELVVSEGKGQKFEIAAVSVDLIGAADATYPLQKKRHSFEFLREIAHLRPRTNTFGAMNRLRSKLSFGIHKYFQERGFCYAHTPIIST